MGISSLNVRQIKTIWIVPFLLTLLASCEAIMDMDKVTAPEELMWEKKGVSGETKDIEMRQCTPHPFNISSTKSWDVYETCLLRKGYKFIPNPQELPHWEKEGTYWVDRLNDPILVECAHKTTGGTLSAEELYANLDMLNSCMHNKGYTYKPSDGRYANDCSRQREGSIACKSTQWGFKLPPEK